MKTRARRIVSNVALVALVVGGCDQLDATKIPVELTSATRVTPAEGIGVALIPKALVRPHVPLRPWVPPTP